MSEEAKAPTTPDLPSSWSLILTLGMIAMMSGLFVVLAYQLTLPRITLNRQKALERAIFTVLPDTTSRINLLLDESGPTKLPDEAFAQANAFAGYDADGNFTGLAMEASARGYQDVVKILYGYSPESECVIGITVLESRETPGLGDKIIKDPAFLANFAALDLSLNKTKDALQHPVVAVKNGRKRHPWEVDGITGATVSSQAVAAIIDASAAHIAPALAGQVDRLTGPKTEKQGKDDG